MPTARHWLSSFTAGALSVAAFAPWHLPWLLWLTFGLLWWLVAAYPRHGFRLGYAFGLGLFLAGVPWVYTSLHQFGGLIAPVAVVVTGLFAAFLALFPAVACYAQGRLQPPPWLSPLLFTACWVLAEWLRSWIFTGFPWLSLGYVLSDTPLRALFGVGGTWLASSVALWLALVPAWLVRHRAARPLLPTLALLAAATLAMAVQPRTRPVAPGLSVALLQGNYSQDIKWDPEWIPRQIAWYRQTTLAQRAELILWPETAVPGSTVAAAPWLERLHTQLLQRGQGALIGIIDRQDDKLYNALLGLGTLQGRYHKVHLVLLGEYFPMRRWLKLLPGLSIPASDFTHGDPAQPALRLGGTTLLGNICYEDVFGNEMRQRTRSFPSAGLWINASNDAWFGRTAPWQHLQMARMRAVENGRPMLRVTNTGITAVIAADGRVQSSLPPFEQGVLTATVHPRIDETWFLRFGNSWVLMGHALLLLVGYGQKRAWHSGV